MRTTVSGTRANILEAADHLFGELGFDAATTRQIAERSGANKALIHYHFRNKDELFAAVLDRYYARLAELLAGSLHAEGSVRQRFGRLIDGYMDFLQANLSFSHMVQREAAGGRHLERIVEHMTPLLEGGVALLRSAYPDAFFDDDVEPAQLLISFYGMVISYFTYAPVIEPLLGFDPLGAEAMTFRKQHLARMADLLVADLERANKQGDRK